MILTYFSARNIVTRSLPLSAISPQHALYNPILGADFPTEFLIANEANEDSGEALIGATLYTYT